MFERLRLHLQALLARTPAQPQPPANPAVPDPVEAVPPVRPAMLRAAPYDYRVITAGGKIGIHAVRPANSVPYIQALKQRGARFPVVKAVDDVDWLIEARQQDPAIITIARFEIPGNIGEGVNGIENVTNGDYTLFVNTLFAPILAKLQARPELRQAVDYWEICNEPDPPGADGYRKLAECMIACMTRAEQLGIKLALFGWNAGTPEWWELQAVVNTGVFARARAGRHIMTVHEGVFKDPFQGWIHPVDLYYGSPIPATEDRRRWVQVRGDSLRFFNFDPDSGQPTPPDWNDGTAGPLCMRYRFLYTLLKQRDEVIPLVVSEIVYGGGYPQDGGTPDKTVARAGWYDAQVAQDYFVLGHLPFTLGGSGSSWAMQDYDFAYPALINYMTTVKNRPNAGKPKARFEVLLPIIRVAPQPVDPVVPPNPGAPGSANRVIVASLLPRIATLDEKRQLIAGTYNQRETILQSAVDARSLVRLGIGNSLVNAWQAARWSSDIAAFMRQQNVAVVQRSLPRPDSTMPLVSPFESVRVTTTNLLPLNSTLNERYAVVAATDSAREAITLVEGDAVLLARLGLSGSRVRVWAPERFGGNIVERLLAAGVVVETRQF